MDLLWLSLIDSGSFTKIPFPCWVANKVSVRREDRLRLKAPPEQDYDRTPNFLNSLNSMDCSCLMNIPKDYPTADTWEVAKLRRDNGNVSAANTTSTRRTPGVAKRVKGVKNFSGDVYAVSCFFCCPDTW